MFSGVKGIFWNEKEAQRAGHRGHLKLETSFPIFSVFSVFSAVRVFLGTAPNPNRAKT
jgi:hypothetical protein